MVIAQGGDPDAPLPTAKEKLVITAERRLLVVTLEKG